MAICVRDEELIPIGQARQFVPPSSRTGKPVHPSVIFRWIKYGLKAADGTVVKLDGMKCGSSLCTSREAIERFFQELSARAGLIHQPIRQPARHRAKISAQLVESGLKSVPTGERPIGGS